MSHTEKTIEVDVPVSTAYNQWTQFESFPSFMTGVKRVRQLTATTLHWTAEIGGKDVDWTADIVHQEADRHIGWRSTSGAPNAGSVKFEALAPSRTRVTLRIEYEPSGIVEKTGAALGVVAHRIDGDLEKFKDFIEKRGRATGDWRGEIRDGQVTRSDHGTTGTTSTMGGSMGAER